MTNATSEDLLKLDSKLKDDIEKTRHKLRGEMQPIVLNVEDLKQDQALIKQSQHTMQSNIKEIKQDLKEWFLDIKKSLDEHSEKYVDKIEFKVIKDKINIFDKRVTWGSRVVIGALLIAILQLIIRWWSLI